VTSLPLDQAWIINIFIVSGFLHYIKPSPNLAMAKDTMRAVVFKGPGKVVIEDRPIPKLQDTQDIIVKVEKTALCGSELHVFRGHQPSPTDFIMGHEFTGIVDEVGSDVKTVKKGDKIVSPFTVSCGD